MAQEVKTNLTPDNWFHLTYFGHTLECVGHTLEYLWSALECVWMTLDDLGVPLTNGRCSRR